MISDDQRAAYDDILAVGVMLGDTDLENGPLMVVPRSHRGPVWNHHGDDGRFCGLVDPAEIESEIARAVPLTGRAGSMSFHHVRALHGSALNTSDRDRNLLLYEIMAADLREPVRCEAVLLPESERLRRSEACRIP
jgi:phytanoyl-CoA hydroxylase